MKPSHLIFLVCFGFFACETTDESTPIIDETNLQSFLNLNTDKEQDFVIACAAGNPAGFPTEGASPTAVFFYPLAGATDIRYFEAENVADSTNFSAYTQVEGTSDPVFNGYLRKFNKSTFAGERMGIVTYFVGETLHISDPIRIKTNLKPTEQNDLVTIQIDSTSPTFTWEDGVFDENVIYFQVISDTLGNLISGTYTTERSFTFYDTSNVVLNITTDDDNLALEPNTAYNFTMMAVSEDNWVNLLIEKRFVTD